MRRVIETRKNLEVVVIPSRNYTPYIAKEFIAQNSNELPIDPV